MPGLFLPEGEALRGFGTGGSIVFSDQVESLDNGALLFLVTIH